MTDDPGTPKAPARQHADKVGSRLRRHFLTGILVVTPAAVAAWVLYRLLAWVDGLLWDEIRFGWVRPGGIPGVGLITVVLLVLLVGLVVNNYVGRRFYRTWDSLLTRIPLFNKIYVAVKQIGEALLSSDRTVFRAVGMIEYPRKGLYCLVFLTEPPGKEIQERAGKTLRSVFLPTTPNPTSGFLLMVPEENITRLDMTVENGLKMVISGGAFVPEGGRGSLGGLPPAAGPGGGWWSRRFGRWMIGEPGRGEGPVEPPDPPGPQGPPGPPASPSEASERRAPDSGSPSEASERRAPDSG